MQCSPHTVCSVPFPFPRCAAHPVHATSPRVTGTRRRARSLSGMRGWPTGTPTRYAAPTGATRSATLGARPMGRLAPSARRSVGAAADGCCTCSSVSAPRRAHGRGRTQRPPAAPTHAMSALHRAAAWRSCGRRGAERGAHPVAPPRRRRPRTWRCCCSHRPRAGRGRPGHSLRASARRLSMR